MTSSARAANYHHDEPATHDNLSRLSNIFIGKLRGRKEFPISFNVANAAMINHQLKLIKVWGDFFFEYSKG